MPDRDANNERWLEYITKLNDRAITKRQSSGFTNWAILGLIGVLLYRILEQIPQIFATTDPRFFVIPYSIATIINIEVTITFLIALISIRSSANTEIRIMPRISKKVAPIITVPIYILISATAVLDLYVALNKNTSRSWPFYFLGSFMLLSVQLPILKKIYYRIKTKGRTKELPELISPVILRDRTSQLVLDITAIVIATPLITSATICLIDTLSNSNVIQNFDSFKLCLNATILCILVLALAMRFAQSFGQDFLERLERRIIIENLTAEQIKSTFIQEFLGETTREWIEKIHIELSTKFSTAIQAITIAEKEMSELTKIDPAYTHEIKARKDKICNETMIESVDDYLTTARSYNAQLKHLLTQQAFLPSDTELLKQILVDWDKQIDEISSKRTTVCDACKSTSNNLTNLRTISKNTINTEATTKKTISD